MATQSSILAWRIPWTEEPGGLQSMGSHRVQQDWVTNPNLYKGFINVKSLAFTNQGTSITLTQLLYSVENSPLEVPLSLFLELSLGLKSCGGKRKYSLWSHTWLVKNPPGHARDAEDSGSIPRSGRSSGVGNGNPLQSSCLGNPMDRGARWATVHGVAKSHTWLSDWTHTHTRNMIMTGILRPAGRWSPKSQQPGFPSAGMMGFAHLFLCPFPSASTWSQTHLKKRDYSPLEEVRDPLSRIWYNWMCAEWPAMFSYSLGTIHPSTK